MSARIWPKIKPVTKNGKSMFLVDARRKGVGERRFFDRKGEAEGWAQQQKVRDKNEGESAFNDRELRGFGWTVQRAIDFALEHLRAQSQSKGLSEAVAALVESKRGEVGGTRLADIENRLTRFSDAIGAKTLRQIDADDVKAFLATIPHPATRNDYRKEIVMLWHFAYQKPRRWVSAPFDKGEVKRSAEPEKGRVILTVEQAISLMAASLDPDIRALNAMVLFGGVRREEVEKLDWSAVNFKTGHIEISAEVSKVSAERYAPIPDNLRAWLEPLAKRKGPIVSRILMRPLRATWKRAGIYPWPQDAHRHSFISYRRAIVGDSMTALEAGTSEKIIKKHYKRPVLKEDAVRFSQIVPDMAPGKIISISEAA